MKKTTLGRPLFYDGKVLGYVQGNRFQPVLDALETLDFLAEVDIDTRIRLRAQASDLYRLTRHHELRPRDYITPFEAALWAMDHARSKKDLRKHSRVAWRMLHSLQGLEDKVFPELQPA